MLVYVVKKITEVLLPEMLATAFNKTKKKYGNSPEAHGTWTRQRNLNKAQRHGHLDKAQTHGQLTETWTRLRDMDKSKT